MENENLGLQVDFLPVGTGERSGDAIAIRYGRLHSTSNFSQKVIVIDGGTLESGRNAIEHIKKHYNTDVVDLVINTHPDNDHASGLRELINNLKVREVWLHTPWNYAEDFINLFKDGRMTENSLKEKLKEGLNTAYEIEQLAKSNEIIVSEPFAGKSYDDGIIRVLGPSESYYKELLPYFRDMPSPISESVSKALSSIKEAINWVQETLHIATESLREDGETSAENNSSTIVLFSIAEKKYLFTGDAGIPALKSVIDYAKTNGINLTDLVGMQVPHHGSKRNISPSILDAIKCEYAFISCAPGGDPKHPAKKVTNALKRRNVKSYATKGVNICHNHNAPARYGYYPLQEIPFYSAVEE